ncbi:hypothetical protein NQ317_009794 [Molorchus minor]|uniref:Lipocalin/cytosolic fatty-acid binding domain-containing protein n=1 Tax=Molorchus minor TaxID=1323400 RepID=A0ABQ9JG26_9CUCU|nr:hypothetical protein NQ317_009794 [Molorchus minor]
MVQIAGKYQLVETQNFDKFLVSSGVSEEKAKKINEAKPIIDVSFDGNRIKIETNLHKLTTELVLDQESEEKLFSGQSIKSVAKLVDNVITVKSVGLDGNSVGKRTMTFSDSGMETVYTTKDNIVAKRIYKRV